MLFFGFTIIESNATDMIPWLLMSILTLVIFIMNGLVNFKLGIPLVIGMFIGGYIGAHMAVKKGDKWIKTIFIFIVVISAIKILFF